MIFVCSLSGLAGSPSIAVEEGSIVSVCGDFKFHHKTIQEISGLIILLVKEKLKSPGFLTGAFLNAKFLVLDFL